MKEWTRLVIIATIIMALGGVATMYYCNGGDCAWMPWYQDPLEWNK